jgi:tyrosine-protein phosphatase SIW14
VRRLAFTLFILGALAPGTAAPQQAGADLPIERFHQVDEHLYRGAQPTKLGLTRLQALGVRTVINIRAEGDAEVENERGSVESLGMRFVHIPIKDGSVLTWSRRIPAETVSRFLLGMRFVHIPIKDGSVLTWSRRIPAETVSRFFEVLGSVPGPVFIHCRRGTDRTGALVAFYRIARHGWDRARALKEANERGMRPWYRGLRQQIETFDASGTPSAPATR